MFFFSGLQTFLSLVSTVILHDFLNFDDLSAQFPVNFQAIQKIEKF